MGNKEIYDSYCKEEISKQYFNAFEIININEDSHSELFKWLMNVKGKDQNSIQYFFFTNFMKKLREMEEIDTDKRRDTTLSDIKEYENFLNKLVLDIDFPRDNKINDKYLPLCDIILISEKQKFILIIENKINAEINVSKGKTQIENYYNFFQHEDFEEYTKKYVFMCAHENQMTEQLIRDKIQQNEIANTTIKEAPINEQKIKDLLYSFNYTVMEHSNNVLIIYNLLKDKYNKYNKCQNGIIYPLSNIDTISTLKIICSCMRDDDERKNIIENILEHKELKEKIENKKIIIWNDYKEKFQYAHSKKIPLKDRLSEELNKINDKDENEKTIINVLSQYVEYFERHTDGKTMAKGLSGYSKIVNGEFIYDILAKIK